MSNNDMYVPTSGIMNFHQQPTEITFGVPGGEWAIRITKDGIESNPSVPTDEGAKAIFEALKPYLQSLK